MKPGGKLDLPRTTLAGTASGGSFTTVDVVPFPPREQAMGSAAALLLVAVTFTLRDGSHALLSEPEGCLGAMWGFVESGKLRSCAILFALIFN